VRLCHRCGHEQEIDGAELMGCLGADAFVKNAINKMACALCAHTAEASWKSALPLSRFSARVGDLMAMRSQLTATCGACRRHWEIDVVDAMVGAAGPWVTAEELLGRLKGHSLSHQHVAC